MDAIARRRASARIILITTVLLVLVVIALFIPIPFTGRATTALGDLVHAPLFAALTLGALWLVQYFRPLRPLAARFVVRVAVVGAAMVATGFATEVAQGYFRRNGAIHDGIANSLGVLAAMLCYLAWYHRRVNPQGRSIRVALLAAAGISIGTASWTPVGMLWDVHTARRQFPLIASFESKRALQRWHLRECEARLTTDGVTHGRSAMEFTVAATRKPGATLCEVSPDWTELKSLELDVVLDEAYPRESAQLIVAVLNRFHRNKSTGSFQSEWTLEPGRPKHISIPRERIINERETRRFDLTSIRYIGLTILEPGAPATLRIDNIRLTLRES